MTKIRKKRIGNNKPLRTSPYPSKDLTGKKFNKLFVLKFEEYKADSKGRRKIYYRCKCDCGNEIIISGNSLLNGQMSCGCSLKEYREWAKINFKPPNIKSLGEASFNSVYSDYLTRSKKKNMTFTLTKEEFKDITSKNCFYCGIDPKQIYKKGKCHNHGHYFHNGIDRIDSSLGYTKENSVPCCEICNKAKRDLSISDFMSWIDRLIKYRNEIK